MEEYPGIAEVIRVMKHPVVEIAEGVEVGGSTVYARISTPADKYSHGLFRVKIAKPAEFACFQHENGLQMENGEFNFDSGGELEIGERLEIIILHTAPKDLP